MTSYRAGRSRRLYRSAPVQVSAVRRLPARMRAPQTRRSMRISSRLYQVEGFLAAVDPVPLAAGHDCRIFFERETNRLVSPLGHVVRHVQLDRMPGIRAEYIVAANRHALLVIGHADRRAGAVAVIADGMAIDRRHQP